MEKSLDTIKPKPELQKQKNSLVVKKGENPGNIEKPLKLTIKVKNNSWFNITIDDLREEDFILSAGEEKSYRGNEIFRLTIGNKQGTNLILNGKSLVIPESEGNIVKDIIINSGLPASDQEICASDANYDGQLNILDILLIVNLILD